MHPLRLRAATALAGLLAGLGVAAVATSAPASAEDLYPRPADGVFTFDGHGWGHGRGMSQWGSQGAATLGHSADTITGFYYPGTSRSVQPNALLRVLVSGDEGTDTHVYAVPGLKAYDLATGTAVTLPTGPTRWRATPAADGLRLSSYDGRTWTPYALGGRTAVAGPVQFGGTEVVRLAMPDGTSRDYRYVVQAVRTSATSLRTLNTTPFESYLRGVVPREAVSSWKPAALQAQSIAARSYSAWKRAAAPASQGYDICDTTQCQVYTGAASYDRAGTRTAVEQATTDAAVAATAGVLRTFEGRPAFTEFSSSNGGWTVKGSVPYQVAKRDDWDGAVANSVHSWKASVTVAQIEARFPAVGRLDRLRVTQRDGNGEWGGRVKTVVLEGRTTSGAATSVTTTGAGIYNVEPWPASSDGLKSSWWRITTGTAFAVHSTVVARSGAPSLVQSPGTHAGVLAVTLKNAGAQSWSGADLHLAVASPVGAADPLAGGSTRPGAFTKNVTRPGATTVAPGEVAELRVPVDGDLVAPGTYSRSYRARLATGPLFGATVTWQVPVAAARLTAASGGRPTATDATPAGGAPSPVFADGRTVVVPVDGSTGVRVPLRNSGNVTWPGAGPVQLGTSGPRDRNSPSAGHTWLSSTRAARLAATTTAGAAGRVDLRLHGAGRLPGVTQESFEPVWEGQGWLPGATVAFTVVRVDPASVRAAGPETPVSPVLAMTNQPGSAATVVLRLRNLGGSPWERGRETLTTGSDSPLRTPAWVSASTPPKLAVNVSRPSVAQVFPGEVGEWRVPLTAAGLAPGRYAVPLRANGPAGAYGPTTTVTVDVTAARLTGQVTGVHGRVSVPRSGTATTWYDVKNTGNVAWPVGGVVRSESLVAAGSPSRAPSWLSPLRPGPLTSNLTVPGATTVRPGEVARFRVVLAGNGRTPRTTSEPFGVVWEGWTRTGLRIDVPYAVTG